MESARLRASSGFYFAQTTPEKFPGVERTRFGAAGVMPIVLAAICQSDLLFVPVFAACEKEPLGCVLSVYTNSENAINIEIIDDRFLKMPLFGKGSYGYYSSVEDSTGEQTLSTAGSDT